MESAGEMEGFLDDVGKNTASEESFPFAEDANACRNCNFRKACPRFG